LKCRLLGRGCSTLTNTSTPHAGAQTTSKQRVLNAQSASRYIPHKARTSPHDHPRSGHRRTSTPPADVALPHLNMTPRSPTHKHPKTATISRRLRNRADQHLALQPPELFRLTSARSYPAANLPEPRHTLLDTQRQDLQQDRVTWKFAYLTEDPRPSHTLYSARRVGHQPVYPDLEQTLAFSPHYSSHGSHPVPKSAEPQDVRDHQQRHLSVSGLPPSPLPSVSGSLDFEAPLTSAEPQQSRIPVVELQEMR
jgi:hypothetical protein